MSTGQRIWRIARGRVMAGLSSVRSAAFQDGIRRARRELEEFLQQVDPQQPGMGFGSPRSGSAGNAGAARARGSTFADSRSRASRPTPPPKHPFEKEYGVLGVPVGADLKTVRRRWRLLVRETHPDRFAGDPDAQRKASERLRRINAAYEPLRKHLERSSL